MPIPPYTEVMQALRKYRKAADLYRQGEIDKQLQIEQRLAKEQAKKEHTIKMLERLDGESY